MPTTVMVGVCFLLAREVTDEYYVDWWITSFLKYAGADNKLRSIPESKKDSHKIGVTN